VFRIAPFAETLWNTLRRPRRCSRRSARSGCAALPLLVVISACADEAPAPTTPASELSADITADGPPLHVIATIPANALTTDPGSCSGSFHVTKRRFGTTAANFRVGTLAVDNRQDTQLDLVP